MSRRLRRRRYAGGIGLVLALAWPPLAAAQSGARVHLGSDVTRAGETARVSLTLGEAGEPVAALVDEITVPAGLTFVEGELGEAGTAASATLETEALDDAADGEARRLRVRIRSAEGGALAGGVVAILVFRAAAEVDTESVDLPLEHRASVTIAGRDGADATGDPGLVTVLREAPAVIACFFYMH